MLTTLKALADPSRLRLVALLSRGEFTVQELTAILGMGQSRISRHLKILADAGILSVERQGTWAYYRMGETNLFFAGLWPLMEARLEDLPERKADLEGFARVFEQRRRRSQDFFDRHARQWDDLAREVLPLADYLPQLLAVIPPCETLLEVGVGTGALLPELRRKARRVVGVDHSPAMLDEARRRVADLDGVELRLGEMAHLPLSDNGCRAALINMVLHHAVRPAEVLSELGRVVAPGGDLVIADMVRHERDWMREKLADQWLGFEKNELAGWLAAAGFDLKSYTVAEGEGEELAVFIAVARKPA